MLWKLHTCARCSVRYLYLFITCTLWGSKINWWYDCFLLLPMLITMAINKPWINERKRMDQVYQSQPTVLAFWACWNEVLVTFWCHLWSTTEQMHGNMEFIFQADPSVSVVHDEESWTCVSNILVCCSAMFSGEPHMKRTRVLIGNFERTPKGYRDPALRAWFEMCFTP